MSERMSNVTTELRSTAEEAKAMFGGLSNRQLNWKPSEKSWSIAQCLDHLITAHSLYFPLFTRLADGDLRQTFWEKHSPLSGFFGRFLIKSLDPKNPTKMKTTSKGQPSTSEIGGDIIERFAEHQRVMAEHLERLPADIEPETFTITSPLLGFATYTLGDALIFLPKHCRRHFDQAKRVLESKEFPLAAEANHGK